MSLEAIKRAAILPPGAFRLALAVAVVVSHVSRFDIGRLAVLLFFYLSGYWVARIWAGEFEGRRWGAFYASRWLRIAPLYFLAMALFAWLRGLPVHVENFTLLGLDTTHRDPTGVAWSLDIELQFYLLMPLLLAAPKALRLPGLIVLAAAGWGLHYGAGVNTALMYLPVFALGMLNAKTRWSPDQRVALASLSGFLAITILSAAIPFTAAFLNKRTPDPFDIDLFGMLWMLPLTPYVAASLAIKSTKLDRDMGNWSYPLYLVHVPLIVLFTAHGLSKWLALPVAFGLALAMFYGPDRAFEQIRRRIISVQRLRTVPA